MKKPIDVSVVIPTYNHVEALSRAVQSVIDQTFQNFEIVIGDDGSTEDSKLTIDWFRDLRIRHIRFSHQDNIARAKNYAMRHAQGKYITFLDPEFEWQPDKLETQLDHFAKNTDLVMAWGNVTLDAGKNETTPGKSRVWLDPVESIINEDSIHLSTVMMRKDLLHKTGLFYEGSKFSGQEDPAFLLQVGNCGPGLYDSTPAVIWHQDTNYPRRANRDTELTNRIEMLRDFVELSEDNSHRKLATRQINKAKRRLAALSLRSGHFRDATKMIFAG